MMPTLPQAAALHKDGGSLNPGPWIEHSGTVAQCARRIANACGMNPDKAYVLGLLHDIGRRYGFTYLRHAHDGYRYLLELGYDEAARVCLTHVFSTRQLTDYIGQIDVTPEALQEILQYIETVMFDEYDLLIQLCDTLAGTAVVDMRARIADVERRYGRYTQAKRFAAEQLKTHFETRCGDNIYRIVTDDETLWGL